MTLILEALAIGVVAGASVGCGVAYGLSVAARLKDSLKATPEREKARQALATIADRVERAQAKEWLGTEAGGRTFAKPLSLARR